MKKYLLTVLVFCVIIFAYNGVSAGNTQIWLVILWSWETLSGNTSWYFPPITWTTTTGSISTWTTHTWTSNWAWAWWNIWVPSVPILPLPNLWTTWIVDIIPTTWTNITWVNLTWNMPLGNQWWENQRLTSIFGLEMVEAYNYAKSVWITNTSSIETARIYDPITRWEVAKMIVEYVKNVKRAQIETIQVCSPENYKDVNNSMREARYISDICSLYVMGRKNDGKQIIEKFRLYDALTRAEFGTILSRYLYWSKYMWDTSNNYYEKHLKALKEAKIMNKIDIPEIRELRWNIMIMLHRLSK